MNILFTVVVEPRRESHGTACSGLYRSRVAAQRQMEIIVRENLQGQGLDEDEIDEYMGADSIDTADTCYAVSPVYLGAGEIQSGCII